MTGTLTRLDGSTEWNKLPPDTQAAIGAAAIELVAAWIGLDHDHVTNDCLATPTTRAFADADRYGYDLLVELVAEAVPAIDPDAPPLPAGVGPVCRGCGRTETSTSRPPCHWAEPDLCSACAPAPKPVEELCHG